MRFPGKVALVYPHLDPATRTVRVRIELPNHELLLRPDMYAEAEIDTGSGQKVLGVPDNAVIDAGIGSWSSSIKAKADLNRVRSRSAGLAPVMLKSGMALLKVKTSSPPPTF
jgi:multidrug efflux pump subunit AcrA (membrane-fusion protein)